MIIKYFYFLVYPNKYKLHDEDAESSVFASVAPEHSTCVVTGAFAGIAVLPANALTHINLPEYTKLRCWDFDNALTLAAVL